MASPKESRILGTMYFDMGANSMYIPATPWGDKQHPALDPNHRDAVLHPKETPEQWHAAKPRWSFSESTRTLESPYMMAEFSVMEIQRVCELASSRHGEDAVKSVVLWLAPECVDRQYTELRAHGFVRAGHRETSIPQLCWIGQATKVPERPTPKESESDRQLREARALVRLGKIAA